MRSALQEARCCKGLPWNILVRKYLELKGVYDEQSLWDGCSPVIYLWMLAFNAKHSLFLNKVKAVSTENSLLKENTSVQYAKMRFVPHVRTLCLQRHPTLWWFSSIYLNKGPKVWNQI